MIFEITSDGVFYFGSLRILVYLETIFYLLFTALLLVIRRSYVRKSVFYSIILYIIFSIFGHTYQYFVAPYTQTLSLAASAGLLLIFLVFQNPDYERDRTTGMYRDLGLQKIKKEDALYNINRPVIGLGFENFYSLRSLYGDETFDIIFSKVAKYLRTIMPEYYIFYCRNGNFLAFYDGNIDRVQELKKEILSRFSGPFKSENEDVYLSPIFIYSTSDVPMESLEIFYNSIHLAFDTAIAIGKGGVCQITNEIHDKAVRNVKVEKALKKALHNNSLLVYYQPIYSTLKGKICSAEALVRLYDDELGILYPDEFIWRAEANGSVLTLGEQVFRKVCEFVSQQDMEKLGLEFIDVNLSPLQCMRRQLAEEFETIMKEYHIDPKYINLEITETASTDIKVIKDNMNQLCDQGVTFALDDYGSGFSNLVNVLSLPLSIIKIDKSIVWAYFNDGNDLLLRVIQTFENKNLHLVVEGVETEEMAKKLAELGCHYEQGYFYSKPIPEVDFLNYLKQNKH
ncbi:MAG: GGDEF domain-containing phosphodiesterase [Lachnospiraceae bacterium]|nr:GGDEF domain-containing phosphodiesterase [Lachnospiraceae bacterium]